MSIGTRAECQSLQTTMQSPPYLEFSAQGVAGERQQVELREEVLGLGGFMMCSILKNP